MLYLIHIEDLTGVSNKVKGFESTPSRMFLIQDVYIEQ
jgi:hypothetical protein